MTKILLINSDALYKFKSQHFIHNSTGTFLNNLKKIGFQPIIFHFFLPLKNSAITAFDLEKNDIEVRGVDRGTSKLTSYLRATFKLLETFNKVDFIYCFYPNAFAFNLIVCKLLGKQYGLYLRGENGIESKLAKHLYKNAKFVTTISPSFTDIVKKYNLDTYTIAPMIDYGIEDIVLQEKNNYSMRKNILFIGRVERDKGVFELIEAVIMLKNKNINNFLLNIIGQGADYLEIQMLIEKFELNDLVVLRGIISDKNQIKKFYNDADLFVLPTYHEGFPRVLYEAMIFKVPIITTFVGSIPNLMIDDYNCFKIATKSAISILDVIQRVLNNYKLTTQITENATNTIREYLTIHNRSHQEIIYDNI